MDKQSRSPSLINIYHHLFTRYGPQHWWPAQTPFEVIIGAILTQSTSWSNAEKAINNLKSSRAITPKVLRQLSVQELARLVHPCGYYNAKALKLKSFANWLGEYYSDDLSSLFTHDISFLRQELLSIHGIGQETADSIILYAANKPIFVIDAYTRRITNRICITVENESYTDYQTFLMNNLPTDARLFNEYHALLVRLAKDVCHKSPICRHCCLNNICQYFLDWSAGKV